MKAKKTAPPRRRISFAVDRDEIEINSDWVDAVMNPVQPAPSRDVSPPAIVNFPSSQPAIEETAASHPSIPQEPGESGLFFAPEENNATDAKIATDERCTAVENDAAVVNLAPVAEIAAVENQASVEESATVVDLATVESKSTVETGPDEPVKSNRPYLPVAKNATVANKATDESNSTGELYSSTKDHRVPRPRPILRVTDGLTPGQYAVYSLMYEAGEGTDSSHHIYKGGYADLGRLTGLSKRGIQNIVAELQAKQVIRMHQQPGYHRTETSAYLIPDADAVLHTWFANGWRHALGKSKTLVS